MSIIATLKDRLRKLRRFLAGAPTKKEIDRRIIEAARARAIPTSKPLPPLPNNPYELDRRVRTMRKIFCAKFGYYPDVFVVGPEVGHLLVDMMNRQLPSQPDQLGGLPGSRTPIQIQKHYWNSQGLIALPGNATYMTMEVIYDPTPGRCQVRSSVRSKLPPELR